MKYQRARKFLAGACLPLLKELKDELLLTDDEAVIFEHRYLKLDLREKIYNFIRPMSESSYNNKHNSILSKVEVWLEYKNR